MAPRGGNKRIVYDYFLDHDAEATEAFGQTLGLKLSRLKRWLRRWLLVKQTALSRPKQQHVELIDDKSKEPRWLGIVVNAGDEQSEVKWIEASENLVGHTVCIPNSQLRSIVE